MRLSLRLRNPPCRKRGALLHIWLKAQEAREPVAEAAAPTTPKIHSGGRSEAKTARRAHRERSARVQRAERRTPPSTRVVRVVHAPEEDFDAPMNAASTMAAVGTATI